MQRSNTFRLMSLGVVLVGSLLMGTAAATNYDGSLDPSLSAYSDVGTPGLFRYGPDLGGDSPYTNIDNTTAVAAQVDGKMVVAGFSGNYHSAVTANFKWSQYACVLARFNANGSLDSSFGSGGRVVWNFPTTYLTDGAYDCYLTSIALQGNGKIVVAGNIYDTVDGERGLVMRFNANGTPDAGFNNGISANSGFVLAGNNSAFSSVAINLDGSIISAGHAIQGGHSDEDFFFEIWSGDNGNAIEWHWAPFNLGADNDDRAYAIVLHDFPPFSSGNVLFPGGTDLYLVGSANNTVYGDGLTNHDCAIAAFVKYSTDTNFHPDTRFNGSGFKSIDLPVIPSNEGDNICRAAVARPGGGIIIGGENYFISTLGGVTPGLASNYALAEVDASGNVTRQDSFAVFQELGYPGIFNGIQSMARTPDGKLIIAGSAGTSNPDHAPADGGVVRLNANFSHDASFGTSAPVSGVDLLPALTILSLDGINVLDTSQNEWSDALAVDNHGRIIVVGNRSYNYGVSTDYDWMIGRLNTSDEIFRDSFDGVVPPVH